MLEGYTHVELCVCSGRPEKFLIFHFWLTLRLSSNTQRQIPSAKAGKRPNGSRHLKTSLARHKLTTKPAGQRFQRIEAAQNQPRKVTKETATTTIEQKQILGVGRSMISITVTLFKQYYKYFKQLKKSCLKNLWKV